MCLYVKNQQPLIADKDIVVLKYLNNTINGIFTPYMNKQVILGETMIPEKKYPHFGSIPRGIGNLVDLYSITSGIIHSRLYAQQWVSNYCAKAIIPKGTEYWIDYFGNEIASKELYITNEIGNPDDVSFDIFNIILKDSPEVKNIRVGDFYMSDNTFAHPNDRINQETIVGLVCGFYEDDTPMICAMKHIFSQWCNNDFEKKHFHVTNEKVLETFNGFELTQEYKKLRSENKIGIYQAFEACLNYRKKYNDEQWFFPSIRELITIWKNMRYINASCKLSGIKPIIEHGTYWSSTNFLSEYVYVCQPEALETFNWSEKNNVLRVIPFLKK